MSYNRYNNEDFSTYPSEADVTNYYGGNELDQQAYIINSSGAMLRRSGGSGGNGGNGGGYKQSYYIEKNSASGTPTGPQKYEDYKQQEPTPIDINNLVLPPPNLDCYVEPAVPRGTVTYLKHNEPTVTRTITLNFNSVKTVVRENVVHHQHNKTVITNVNRNHWHTQRIVVKDNNYHHYLINNVVRINDIHHQKVEQVRGEGKSFNDFKQTQRIEAAKCEFTDKDNKSDAFGKNNGSAPTTKATTNYTTSNYTSGEGGGGNYNKYEETSASGETIVDDGTSQEQNT